MGTSPCSSEWCVDTLSPSGNYPRGSLRAVPAWIVMWVVIFKAKRTDCRYLSDVFAGLRPVEMPGFAWKNDDASRRIGLHLVAIEGLPEADVKNARHDRVDTILWMLVRHQFRAVRHLDPGHVRTGFRGMAYKDRQASPGRKPRERLPVDVFGQDHSKISLIRLMIAGHGSHPFLGERELSVKGSTSRPT